MLGGRHGYEVDVSIIALVAVPVMNMTAVWYRAIKRFMYQVMH